MNERKSVFCPDITDEDGMSLFGDISMLEASISEFKIVRCNDTKREAEGKSSCKSEEDIDDYVKDIQVETWTIQNSIDFSKYD